MCIYLASRFRRRSSSPLPQPCAGGYNLPVRFSLVFPTLVFIGGCFSYAALDAGGPRRGSDVVAQLAAPLAVPLQDVTVRQVVRATGTVSYVDQDSLVLAVERFRSEGGTEYPGLGATLAIRRSQISELRQRHVSTGRTALLLGAGAAALTAIVYSVGSLRGTGSGAPPGPPPAP